MNNKTIVDFEFAKARLSNLESSCKERKFIEDILTNGYTVIPASDDYIFRCLEALNQFKSFKKSNLSAIESVYGRDSLTYRMVNLHCALPALADLFANMDTALKVLDFFLEETVVYTSLYFERGSMQDIHRDTPYFCTTPEYLYMGVWCALEDVDSENGPLLVVPRGHLLPELDRAKIFQQVSLRGEETGAFSEPLWNEYQNALKAQFTRAGLEVNEVHVKKGDIIIWHPQTPHGGKVCHLPERSRNSIVFHVTPPNVPVGYQDVFYGKVDAKTVNQGELGYKYVKNRRILNHNSISLAHQKDLSIQELVIGT